MSTQSPLTPKPKIGIVICNLGTPQAPTVAAVSTYLKEFLSDKRVVETPDWLWQPILRGIVIPKRVKTVAHNYATIWLPEGAPLLVYTEKTARGVAQRLNNPDYIVDIAMRYGEPSLHSVFDKLAAQGCEKILVMPMYPQYAAATTGTVGDELCRYNLKVRNQLEFRMPKRYFQRPEYIQTLAQQVSTYWQTHGKPQGLLLSFHGMPKQSIDEGDPYQDDCEATYTLLQEALFKEQVPLYLSYQSQFGKAEWIKPSTVDKLSQLAQQGVLKLDVLCPGFSVDCLETLEEIAISGQAHFKQQGGQQFRYIPCLNADDAWLDALTRIIQAYLQDW
ncbi:ferrochelatase [Brackiella oedipodis]|uniref:ferrochelatase n=1 Tax=Brackiella oedipodis TaxID=124225 RepID=UPI00056FAB4D|nr:ferrochelatase [Brackiella oedipodis]